MEYDGDLFAVVRPYITSSSTTTTTTSPPSFSGFDPSRSSNFFSLYHAQQPQNNNSHNAISATTPKLKTRKIQPKKVCEPNKVCVHAQNRSSDLWAWRKYGEKPIVGSPYRRGYFRCSSSKGCVAKKQVQQNKSNPTVFTVRYFGEHNHPPPIQRNSFADSTMQKSLSPQIVNVTPVPNDFFEGLEEFISSQPYAKVYSSTPRAEVDIFKGLDELTCLDDFKW